MITKTITNVGKEETISHITDMNVKWCTFFSLALWRFPQKLGVPHDPTILLLVLYTRNLRTCVHTKLVHKCS